MTTLNLLCAGAAMGLVKSLQPQFERDSGAVLQARFGAVGAMKEALLAGEACDVMLVTRAMIDALIADGRLRSDGAADLGRVRTGVAVPAGRPVPPIDTPRALKAALLDADAIYFPDPVRATAGIHFAKVMQELGIHDALQPRFRTFPNGATSMRELAAAGTGIGCTQVSEILYTEGITLVGALPTQFELATVYTAALEAQTDAAELATRFVAMLAAAERRSAGFEP